VKKLLIAVVLAVAVLAGGSWIAYQTFKPYHAYSGAELVKLEPGTGAASAARLLASRGVLRGRVPFLALYALGRYRRCTLKAGEYLFDRPLSPRDVYWKLVHGDIYYHLVVIPEGSDRFDIARILQQKLGINPQDFLRATGQVALIHDLDPAAPTLEGYLFPDSYRFPASTTAAAAVEAMVGRFRRVLDSRFRQDLGSGDPSLHGALTLASLVEKETPDSSERPEIAGVFVRRLERGMLLDCDPTVVYAARLENGTDDDAASKPQPITASELNSDSPYNTYRHAGLPPGPICSPGAAALEAALHPAPGDTLYFVSNLHGGHVFARTLAEHQHNVARYRHAAAATGEGALSDHPAAARPQPAARGQARIDQGRHRARRKSRRHRGKP
jgi:peptidoglycan lytic transglycosylase G